MGRAKLAVRGTLTRVDGRLVVTPPKTAQSRRVLPLAPAEVAMLAAHRRDQAEERSRADEAWNEAGFVFTTETGQPMDSRNVLRAMTTAATKAGLDHVNVHTLRHSAATAWLEAGVNVKADSASRAAMTVLSYSLREPPTA